MTKKQILGYDDSFPGGKHVRNVDYEGILLKPIDPPEFSRDIVKGKLRIDSREQQTAERIKALFEHYHLSDGEWATLALKLADRHVPGFQWKGVRDQQRGRSTLGSKYPELFNDVKLLVKNGDTIKTACQKISRRPAYKSLTAAAIERRYYEYKRSADPKKLRK